MKWVWLYRVSTVALLLWLGVACARPPDPRLGMPADATPGEIAEARRLLDLALDDWIEQTTRLQRISQRIRVAGAELCGDELGPVLGLSFLDIDWLTPELVAVARQRFPERRALHVVGVFEGMPAARAGIRSGDAVTSIGGVRTYAVRRLARTSPSDAGGVSVGVLRDGISLDLEVEAPAGCRIHSVAVHSEQLQATTDGIEIRIHSALLRELADDVELAFVVGHEMAHAIIGYGRWSNWGPEVESRADRLGLYLAARAGFEMASDAEVFEKLKRDLNRLAERPGSHPPTHERTRALRSTVEEIRGKIERGEPLVPDSV